MVDPQPVLVCVPLALSRVLPANLGQSFLYWTVSVDIANSLNLFAGELVRVICRPHMISDFWGLHYGQKLDWIASSALCPAGSDRIIYRGDFTLTTSLG